MKKILSVKTSIILNVILVMAIFWQAYQASGLRENNQAVLERIPIETICDLVVQDQQKSAIEAYTGEPAPVNFESNSDAKLFRTTIVSQVAEGANFAGHYTVATWGCGTSCRGFAIVDVITGNIVKFEPGNESVPVNDIAYYRDTNILVLNPRAENARLMTAQEVIEDGEAYFSRVYYELVESTDDTMPSLRKLCTENVYSGLVK